METFVAADHDFKNIHNAVEHMKKWKGIVIRDLQIDNKIKMLLLEHDIPVIQSMISNKEPLERIEDILKNVKNIVVYSNGDSSENLYFLKCKNAKFFDENLEEIKIDGEYPYIEKDVPIISNYSTEKGPEIKKLGIKNNEMKNKKIKNKVNKKKIINNANILVLEL